MVPQPAVYPTIELTRGADFYDLITVYEEDGVTVANLTNHTFRWQFRAGRTQASALLADLNRTAGATLSVDMMEGTLAPLIRGSNTVNFPDRVYHDLRVNNPEGRCLYWWKGELVMTDSVTVPSD